MLLALATHGPLGGRLSGRLSRATRLDVVLDAAVELHATGPDGVDHCDLLVATLSLAALDHAQTVAVVALAVVATLHVVLHELLALLAHLLCGEGAKVRGGEAAAEAVRADDELDHGGGLSSGGVGPGYSMASKDANAKGSWEKC